MGKKYKRKYKRLVAALRQHDALETRLGNATLLCDAMELEDEADDAMVEINRLAGIKGRR